MSDIGRGDRQRQVINAIMHRVVDPQWLRQPAFANHIIDTGLAALTVDEDSSILTFVSLALAFRAATGPDGVTGTPPISNLDFRPGDIGSTVQIDPATSPQFWVDLRDGNLTPGGVGLGH
jgi:anionic cell wall polymer biosynthesis LytR-Cps2A-Psr (LCP) family protein